MSITLGNAIHVSGQMERFEETASPATIKPGHLIQKRSDGNVELQSTAGGRCERLFALENDNVGVGPFDSTINMQSAFAAGKTVPCAVFSRGARLWAWLKAGVSYAIGDKLVAAGDGTLEKESGLPSAGLEKDCIAVVQQALVLNASGAVATQGLVRII